MNRVFGAYVWKEWRDQRAGLLRLSVALVGLALCALLLPRLVAGDELFLACFVGAALCAHALSVGSDLLAGELARDRVRFLERLPGGLSAAFAGKLAFLTASGAAIALFGLLLALGVSQVRTGALPVWPAPASALQGLALGGAVLLWTFATSTWVPRSALALPVSLALLALLGWPFWLLVGSVPWYAPARGELELCLLLCLLGAPLSAWASFALGCRRGGGPGRALLCGGVAAVLVLLPSWTWTGARVLALRRLEPSAADFRILGAVVGADQRYLFATCSRELPYGARMDGRHVDEIDFAVVVDLERGSWEATRGASFRPLRGCGAWAVEMVLEDGERRWLDARTAQPIPRPDPLPRSRYGLPAPEDLGLAADLDVEERRGLGYRVTGGIHDPFRRRTFSLAELDGGLGWDGDLLWFLVRQGDWAAYDRSERRWVALDPETGRRTSIAGLGEGESVGAVASDGRLVVSGAGGAALLSPEGGARQPLAIDAAFPEPVTIPPICLRPDDPAVLLLTGPSGWSLARLDLERATLRRACGATGSVRDLGGPDPDSAYVLEDDRRIVRVTFGTDEREVLFPR